MRTTGYGYEAVPIKMLETFKVKTMDNKCTDTKGKSEIDNDFIADVMGSTPREKWENLKKYILTQIEKVDEETPWQNTEPEWWLEMQTIERNIRKYCS